MRHGIWVSLIVVLAAVGARGAIPEDLITSLPGWKGPTPTLQYSGYINITATKHFHYWLVESARSPTEDPLVFWFNGGPGCSSLDGYFYELGPLHFDDGTITDGVPTLVPNPYAWNNLANVVFVESPVGVGFSWSPDSSDYVYNDTTSAEDNFAFVTEFLSFYPEYNGRETFIAGESYAGIYVPLLVQQILLHNQAGASNINLVGFAVGNGCTGNEVGACNLVTGPRIKADFLFHHGLFSKRTFNDLERHECLNATANGKHSAKCNELAKVMALEIGDINTYNVYAPCTYGGKRPGNIIRKVILDDDVEAPVLFDSEDGSHVAAQLDGDMIPGPVECIDAQQATLYLNDAAVKAAIHVHPSVNWTICHPLNGFTYTRSTDSLMPIYPTLIQNFRALIYNGDCDSCVPYNGNEEWTSSLGYEVKESWRPWLLKKQVAGYVTTYTVPGAEHDFTFLTVQGAGHMVPQYKPAAAFAMFERFLSGDGY